MKNKLLIVLSAIAVGVVALATLSSATINNPSPSSAITSPLVVPGASPSTIVGDGEASTIGGNLIVNQNWAPTGSSSSYINLGDMRLGVDAGTPGSIHIDGETGDPGVLIINGTATSTITGDGTDSTIGASLLMPAGDLKISNGKIQEVVGNDISWDSAIGANDGIYIRGDSTSSFDIFRSENAGQLKFDVSGLTTLQTITFTDAQLTFDGTKLVVGGSGTATSTITGDGTTSTIGGDLVINGSAPIVLKASGSDASTFTNTISSPGFTTTVNGIGIGGISMANEGGEFSTSTEIYNGDGTLFDLLDVNSNYAYFDTANIIGSKRFIFPNTVATSTTFSVLTEVPAASSTPCVVGEFAATSTYLYVCVSTNQWSRTTSTITW